VLYSMHLYDRAVDDFNNHINAMVQARANWGVAIHVGEFENDPIQPHAYARMNDYRVNFNKWTYKIAGRNLGGWSFIQNMNHPRVDLETSGLAQIRATFGAGLRTFRAGTTILESGWTLQTGPQRLDAFRNAMRHDFGPSVYDRAGKAGFPRGGGLSGFAGGANPRDG